MSKIILEIACFNVQSALIAANAGADRIEFCTDYSNGGLTPLIEDFIFLKKEIQVPIFIMIRTRGGNFIYSDIEYEKMKTDILNFKTAGADGFVFGILNNENNLDVEKNMALIKLASPIPCTLHRAFDSCKSKTQAIDNALEAGFTRILSSGGRGGALDNLTDLKKLMELANNKIIIMPGGGIRSTTINKIIEYTNCAEIHSAAIINNENLVSQNEIEALKNAIR